MCDGSGTIPDPDSPGDLIECPICLGNGRLAHADLGDNTPNTP